MAAHFAVKLHRTLHIFPKILADYVHAQTVVASIHSPPPEHLGTWLATRTDLAVAGCSNAIAYVCSYMCIHMYISHTKH